MYEVKPKDLQLSFDIFWWPSTWHTIKTNCVNFRLMIQRYAQFWFIRKGSGNSFSTTFCAWYFKKIYSISWPNLIAWLFLFLEILINMCIAIVCFPCFDVRNLEIELIFLIKSLFYMNKESRQILNILRTKRAFKMKKEHILTFLKGFQWPKIIPDFFVNLGNRTIVSFT